MAPNKSLYYRCQAAGLGLNRVLNEGLTGFDGRMNRVVYQWMGEGALIGVQDIVTLETVGSVSPRNFVTGLALAIQQRESRGFNRTFHQEVAVVTNSLETYHREDRA